MMRCQTNLPALNCIQGNASKIIVSEQDVITANKQGFGSDIGGITNKITAITSIMSNYSYDSEEYKILKYRTQVGQALQQESIDRAKGIIPTKMPPQWYIYKENHIKDEDSEEIIARKTLNQRICASKKPYFFMYNYSYLKAEYDKIMSEINSKLINMYKKSYKELKNSEYLTENEKKTLDSFERKINVDTSPSTMNRICWAVEKYFSKDVEFKGVNFDYSIYKTGVEYPKIDYIEISDAFKRYNKNIRKINKENAVDNENKEDLVKDKVQLLEEFKVECETICPNSQELCEILIDMCYGENLNKNVVWNICGDTIISNLLSKHDHIMTYPEKNTDRFLCCGVKFQNKTVKIGDNDID